MQRRDAGPDGGALRRNTSGHRDADLEGQKAVRDRELHQRRWETLRPKEEQQCENKIHWRDPAARNIFMHNQLHAKIATYSSICFFTRLSPQ